MKYTKKMRLVEIDDVEGENTKKDSQYMYTINDSDDAYTKAKVLSSLDKEMSSILRNNEMNDYDEWNLYKRSFQRYMNFIENTKKPENILNTTTSSDKKKQKDWLNNTYNSFNTDHPPRYTRVFDTEIPPQRDSIDKVTSQPVREFFENMGASNRRNQSSSLSFNGDQSSSMNSVDDMEIDTSESEFDRTNDINAQYVTSRRKKITNTNTKARSNKKQTFSHLGSPALTRKALKRRADLGLSMMTDPKRNLLNSWEPCKLAN